MLVFGVSAETILNDFASPYEPDRKLIKASGFRNPLKSHLSITSDENGGDDGFEPATSAVTV